MGLLQRDRAALVVVDVQEGFRPYASFAGVASACAKLVEAARRIGAVVQKRFDSFRDRYPFVGDSRGLGAMRAIELE